MSSLGIEHQVIKEKKQRRDVGDWLALTTS